MSRRLLFILSALAAALMLLAAPARADSPQVYSDDTGRAIRGYDAVAYFTEGAAREGSPEFSLQWMDATWLFASAENRDAFAADPEAYAPQFGGYCAYAVAKGSAVEADPRIWAIVEGKLYLNLGAGVQKKWEADRTALIAGARNRWPSVLEDPGKRQSQAGSGDR
jgi:hypothetical protein